MRKLKNSELNRISVNEFKTTNKIPLVIVLDNIRSLNNIGSVFRTSDAFLVNKILLCGITACPPKQEIHKTALGATESVDWEYYKNTVDAVKKLKTEGYTVISIEQVEKSVSILDFYPDKDKKYAFVLGNEVKGVLQEVVDICDFTIEIPQFGTKHSLNISVTTGIVIWDYFSKISKIK